MNNERIRKKIQDLIDSYEPITVLMRVSRDIEKYGNVGEEEREQMEEVLEECKALAEGIEGILQGVQNVS